MNSKEDKNERPGGTYTLDTKGDVVRSKGLEDYNGVDVTSLLSRSLSSRSSLFSDFSLSSISLADELKAADDLMHTIDEMLKDDEELKTDRKPSVHANTPTNPSNIETKHIIFPVTMTERLKPVIQKKINFSEEIKAEVTDDNVQSFSPLSIKDEIQDCVNPKPAVQDGLMAVRLPPIENNVLLEDIFQKIVKEEDILHAADLAQVADKSIEIEIDIESRKNKKRGFRKYLCGLCGECESSQKEEKKKTPNCFQKIWKRVKQIF